MTRRYDRTLSRRFPTEPGDETGMWHLIPAVDSDQTWCGEPVDNPIGLTLVQALGSTPTAAPDCQVCLIRYGFYRLKNQERIEGKNA